MKDMRFIGIVALSVAVVVAAAIVLVYARRQTQQSPALTSHQAGKTSGPNRHNGKNLAPSKDTARISAPTTLNYYRVRVTLDGALQTDKHTFHLYGVDVPGRDHTCTYSNGERWACGLRSYVALMNLVGSALIECRPKDARRPDVVICHRDSVDLSEWMLKNGWARLKSGVTEKHYIDAAAAAVAAKAGIWTEHPLAAQGAAAQ